MALPNPGMDAVPFTPLTAEFLDDMIENIESLSDGTGFENGAITTNTLAESAVTGSKIDFSAWLGSGGSNGLQTGTFSTSSSTVVDVGGAGAVRSVTISTKGGSVLVVFIGSFSVNTNTAQLYIQLDGGTSYPAFQISNTSASYVPIVYLFTGLSSGSHTFKLRASIPGGAVLTSTQYSSGGAFAVEL